MCDTFFSKPFTNGITEGRVQSNSDNLVLEVGRNSQPCVNQRNASPCGSDRPSIRKAGLDAGILNPNQETLLAGNYGQRKQMYVCGVVIKKKPKWVVGFRQKAQDRGLASPL